MSDKVFQIGIVMLFIFLLSCDKDKVYSDIPAITMSPDQIYHNPVNIIIDFTDGDGDIGLTDADAITPPYEFVPDSTNPDVSSNIYYYNLLFYYYEKRDGTWDEVELAIPIFYRIPVITPRGQNKALNGEIDVDISLPFNRPDSIRFEIVLIDRALHESNRLQTPVIYK